jgi:hypothetical protein
MPVMIPSQRRWDADGEPQIDGLRPSNPQSRPDDSAAIRPGPTCALQVSGLLIRKVWMERTHCTVLSVLSPHRPVTGVATSGGHGIREVGPNNSLAHSPDLLGGPQVSATSVRRLRPDSVPFASTMKKVCL